LPNAGGLVTFAAPFLSKLDPAGQTLLFSVPVGGAGVQVDSNGAVYVGGVVGSSPLRNYAVPANIPALASVPTQCLPNVTVQSIDTVQNIGNTAYVAQVDGASGNLRGSQFIGGSSLTASAVTLVGSTLWIAGATNFPNFPFTPNALTLASFGPAPLAGAYLGSVDFSQPQLPAGTPQIGCIVDAADFAPAGPVARYQLLTIFGSGLSPATAGSAPVGVSFSVASAPPLNAPLLYVSPTQINVAVPLVSFSQSSSVMQLTVNGASSAPIELPLTYANPSLFAVALNADGSLNSSTNPAALGSAVSVFVNGLTPDPQVNNSPLQLFTNDGWSITNVILASRNLEKCLRIQKRAAGIEVTQIDADDASAVAAIARRHGAKLIVNAALPYQDLSIMEGCLAAGAHYLDTANYEPPDVARFEYRWQWEYHERFEKSGLMALLGCGFDPGQTNIYCAWAAKHLFDEIETLDILDCNDGQHGHPFATNFNPEVNIREVTAPGRYWENGEWHETAPLHITANFDFPEIGSRKTYLMFHEELESLTRHFPSLRRARFWMTFSDRYLNYLRVLQDVGMTRIDEVDFEGRKIVPLRFLKSLLPDPAGMGANYQGRTCIGCLISGTKAGTRRRVFLSNTCDHAECNREVGAQAISYTTGVGAACGAALMLDGTWMRPGVFNVEQFDPDPFMELAAAWGLPWSIREMPVSDAASI
jgi:saccharopine dehydrogenase (NAD+, L-lysine-forming)